MTRDVSKEEQNREEVSMNVSHSQTPAALYARVSSDRQDVDLWKNRESRG